MTQQINSITFPEFVYELYKLDWCKSHNITFDEIAERIREAYEDYLECENENLALDTHIELSGFHDGERYAWYEEFLDNEYQDENYVVNTLLNLDIDIENEGSYNPLYVQYLKSKKDIKSL